MRIFGDIDIFIAIIRAHIVAIYFTVGNKK